MPFHLTTGGFITEIPTDNGQRAKAEKGVVSTREEWEVIAGAWPLKKLVGIWNSFPGVTPVEKFTSRQIALERIWRAVESPEQARAKAEGTGEKAKVHFREGSKAAQVYALLCRPEGATVREIQNLTGSDLQPFGEPLGLQLQLSVARGLGVSAWCADELAGEAGHGIE